MFQLSKSFTFEASHQLTNHDDKCARLHGHSWRGWVTLRYETIHEDGPKRGMAQDYGDIAASLKPLVASALDHHHLNDTIHPTAPTSEAVARFLFDKLKPALPALRSVTIEETATSRCTYEP